MGWPGLAREATQICSKIGFPDIITNKITKAEIKEAIFWSNYESLKDEMAPLKKLQRLVNEDLTRPQEFLQLTLAQARGAIVEPTSGWMLWAGSSVPSTSGTSVSSPHSSTTAKYGRRSRRRQ